MGFVLRHLTDATFNGVDFIALLTLVVILVALTIALRARQREQPLSPQMYSYMQMLDRGKSQRRAEGITFHFGPTYDHQASEVHDRIVEIVRQGLHYIPVYSGAERVPYDWAKEPDAESPRYFCGACDYATANFEAFEGHLNDHDEEDFVEVECGDEKAGR